MIIGIVKIAASFWERLFPERQIYLRSDGLVRYVSLPPVTQLAGGFLLLAVFLWTMFASVNFAFTRGALTSRDAEIAELRINYIRLASELAETQRRFLLMTQEQGGRRRQEHSSLTQNQNSGAYKESAGSTVDQAGPSRILAQDNVRPRPRPEGRRPEISDDAKSGVMPRERPARPALILPETLTKFTDTKGSANYAQASAMEPRLSGAKSSDHSGGKNDVVAYLAADANSTIDALEKLIRQTGLDAETILQRSDRAANAAKHGSEHAEGGPLLTLPPSGSLKFMRRNAPGELAVPATRKGRLEMLREALFSLPLAEPVENYYISSGYGYRRDPFTHAKAFHSGMDLVAPHGAPVLSSAPGVIIFAGRNGPYGNMVEVDHGHGVKSRYGHLSKIAVKRGQKIGLRDLLGLVGNTGRSGTAHLHFEVWFDGKARDPRNFLKAGENVFQRQG